MSGRGVEGGDGQKMMHARLRERIVESNRLQQGQEAETQGLYAAQSFPAPFPYSSELYLQVRFELGFREGKAIMEIEP